MDKTESYENFPISDVVATNLLNILTFVFGALILSGFSNWLAMTYFVFCILTMIWVLKVRCSNCYYFGKRCAAGYGLLAPLLYKKGNNEQFLQSANYTIPILAIPILGGVVLLIVNQNLVTGVFFILFVLITLFRVVMPKIMSNRISCIHCKQKEYCAVYKPS